MKKRGRGSVLLAMALAAVLFVLCSFAGNPSCPPDFDCNSYIAMANDLNATPHVASHHAVRILPSFLVHVMAQAGLSIDQGFSLISKTAFFHFGMGIYAFLLLVGAPALLAFGLTLLLVISNWPMVYHLTNVYQSCDALTYPLTLGIIVFSLRSSARGVFVCSLIGVVCRQSLFPIGICALAGLYWQNKNSRTLAYLLSLAGAFGLLHVLMKADAGLLGILMSGQKSGFSAGKFILDFLSSRIVLFLFPFLPFLILSFKDAATMLLQQKALVLGCLAVILQPVLSYDITGAENAQRLAMQGIWPLFLLSAYLMSRNPVPLWLQITAVLVPFLIGTHHLGWYQTRWSLISIDWLPPYHRWIVLCLFFGAWTFHRIWQRRERRPGVLLADA